MDSCSFFLLFSFFFPTKMPEDNTDVDFVSFVAAADWSPNRSPKRHR